MIGCRSPSSSSSTTLCSAQNYISKLFFQIAALVFLLLESKVFAVSLIESLSPFPATTTTSNSGGGGRGGGCRSSATSKLPLCCSSRNASCRSYEPAERWPAVPLMSVHRREHFPRVMSGNRPIGDLILPDTVALEEPLDANLARRMGCLSNLRVMFSDDNGKSRRSKPNEMQRKFASVETNAESQQEWIVFGAHEVERSAEGGSSASRERIIRENGRQIVRYSTLSKFLPIRVSHFKRNRGKSPISPASQKKLLNSGLKGRQAPSFFSASTSDEEFSARRTLYLAEARQDCFCDEACVKYGDCCSDYRQMCPARDCLTSSWAVWSQCAPQSDALCGVGNSKRSRSVLESPKNAGKKCPPLSETKACFVDCPSSAGDFAGIKMPNLTYGLPSSVFTDVPTVALLLDYRFKDARTSAHVRDILRKRPASSRTYARPVLASKTLLHKSLVWKKKRKIRRSKQQASFLSSKKEQQNVNYCVLYRIDWLNKNCNQWRKKLHPPRVICAECQPEAQFHRPRPRCASDLENGQTGFWKLIGPPSCNGIWRRVSSSTQHQNCTCSERFPHLTPFLFV